MSEENQEQIEAGAEGVTLQPGTIVNGYEIIRELGRGAMAIVYLAKQLDLQRLVALKILSGAMAQDKDYVERFFNEARSAAVLSHPNIIQAYDAGMSEAGLYYFCMEYVDGESMLDIINREARVPLDQALKLMLQVVDALNYGWQNYKFTHGDIKPENIMVNSSGDAKLADFGLAKVEGHEYEGTEVMLTPLYAAPELIKAEQKKNDCRADIYALGATLYHAVAGTPPFPGSNAREVLERHIHENPEPLKIRAPHTPGILSDFVASMLRKKPEERPQTWGEVLLALQSIQKNIEQSDKKHILTRQGPASISKKFRQKAAKPRNYSLPIALAIVLLIVGGGIFLATRKKAAAAKEEAAERSMEVQVQEPVQTSGGRTEVKRDQTTLDIEAVSSGEEEIAEQTEEEELPPEEVQEEEEPAAEEATAQEEAPAPSVESLAITITLTDKLREQPQWMSLSDTLRSLRYSISQENSVEAIREIMEKWRGEAQPQGQVAEFTNFFTGTVLTALSKSKSTIYSSRDIFQGQKIKVGKDLYEIREIGPGEIVTNQIIANKGSFRKIMNWEQARQKGLLNELGTRLLTNHTATEDERKSLCALMIFSGMGRKLQKSIDKFVPSEELENWRMLLALPSQYGNEKLRNAIDAIPRLLVACQEGDGILAHHCTRQLLAIEKQLPKEDRECLEALLENTEKYLPANCAKQTLARLSSQKIEKAPEELLPAALAARILYAREKGEAIEKTNEKLNDLWEELFQACDAARAKRLPQSYIYSFPFVNALSPMNTALISRDASTKFASKPHQEDFERLLPLAKFALGDWSYAEKLNSEKDPFRLEDTSADILPMAKLTGEYAKTLAATYHGQGQIDFAWMEEAQRKLSLYKQDAPVFALLAEAALILTTMPQVEDASKLLKWNPEIPITSGVDASRRLLVYLAYTLYRENDDKKSLQKIARLGKNAQLFSNFRFNRKLQTYKIVTGEYTGTKFNKEIVDADVPWASIRTWMASLPPNADLPPGADSQFLDYLEKAAPAWPISAGDTIETWLIYRAAYSLNSQSPMSAVPLIDKVLDMQLPCTLHLNQNLLALKAGLVLLAGKSGAFTSASFQVRASLASSEADCKAFKNILDLQDGYEAKKVDGIIKKMPEGRQSIFWLKWLGESVAYKQNKQVSSFQIDKEKLRMTRSLQTLAAAHQNFTKYNCTVP